MRDPVQLDLFDFRPPAAWPETPAAANRIVPRALSDGELIAALSDASLDEACALAAEAGARRLGGAVAALVALCKRFVGFARDRLATEQVAALQALSAMGGPAASRAVAQLIVERIVQGPNLAAAVAVAAGLGVKLDRDAALPLLRNADPAIRAAACACARAGSDVMAILIELLADRDGEVATAAACALGAMGRPEAREKLKNRLIEKPSPRVIEAAAALADEEVVVFLARLARRRPDLANCILSALDDSEHSRAGAAAAGLRSWLSRPDRG